VHTKQHKNQITDSFHSRNFNLYCELKKNDLKFGYTNKMCIIFRAVDTLLNLTDKEVSRIYSEMISEVPKQNECINYNSLACNAKPSIAAWQNSLYLFYIVSQLHVTHVAARGYCHPRLLQSHFHLKERNCLLARVRGMQCFTYWTSCEDPWHRIIMHLVVSFKLHSRVSWVVSKRAMYYFLTIRQVQNLPSVHLVSHSV